MFRVLAVIFVLTLALETHAQPSNQWINFSQQYYKIPVAKTGMYKASYLFLQQAGFPVHENPKAFQVFHRGVEQAISVVGEDDGVFNPDDYILFYGRSNDGTLDEKLYPPDGQPHQYINLFSDTTSYFLTIGSNGKRMPISEQPSDGLTAETYHNEEHVVTLAEHYSPGRNLNNEIFTSTFDPNESWTSNPVREGSFRDFQVTGISNTVENAGLPEVEIILLGRSPFFHNAEIFVGESLRLLRTVSFSLADRVVIREPLQWSDISAAGTLRVRLKVAANGYLDQVCLSLIRVNYPQSTVAGSGDKTFHTVPTPENKVYLEIESPPPSNTIYDITEPHNVSAIRGTLASTLKVVVPLATVSRKLFLPSGLLQPHEVRKVNFRSLTPGSQEYVIITHPRLRKPSGSYADPVEAFAAYRASEAGGGFDTLVVHTKELYDQFNYGEKSPLAITQFLQFISVPKAPQFLFLIGKGLEVWYGFHRQPDGQSWNYQDLVPTAGFPGSDALFSAGINGSVHEEGIPTGRLSAMNPAQVALYLDKVIEMENVPANAPWKKNVLHLSGGVEEGEPEQFRNILESYARIAEGPYFGARVTALAKKSRDLETVNVSEHVNNGISLITFFGHSSPNGFDFDLGFVTEAVLGYRNKGKYPILLMNGCEAGAFFQRDTIFAENWLYARDKGAGAFIAHNSYAAASVLEEYSRRFYEVAFGDSSFFGQSLGLIHKETARRHIAASQPSIANLSQIQQMILLGDPALRIFGSRKTDLAIDESRLSIIPYHGSHVNALTDSFAIKMIVTNYGMARGETFNIEVKRVLADNTILTYDSLLRVPDFADTIHFIIRRGSETAQGTNTFHISLDAENIITEIDETNNTATHTLSIPLNGTKNLFPADFSIVHSAPVRFVFQATDVFSGRRAFLLQIDTINTFDSPFLKEVVVEGDVLASETSSILDLDSTAYYWRTKLKDPKPGETGEWEGSSFNFIKDSPEGWAQIHFPQLLSNTTAGLVLNELAREISLESSVTSLDVITYGSAAGKTRKDVSVRVGGAEYNLYTVNTLFPCRDNTVNFIAFDKNSTAPYAGIYLKWYEQFGPPVNACGREPVLINSFLSSEVDKGGTRDVIQYINNIAEGDSVLIFNIGDPSVAMWSDNVKTRLGDLGVSIAQLDQIGAGEPMVILGKKGAAPGTARLYASSEADPATGRLVVNETISGGFSAGTMTSTLIGPSLKWSNILFQGKEDEAQDDFSADVIGVKMNGTREILSSNISSEFDISTIDAGEYPYLQLRFRTSDPILLTPPQWEKWMVFYSPAPEGVLLPDHSNVELTLQEGENWTDQYRFVNISSTPFPDSLKVNVRIFNESQNQARMSGFRIRSPLPLDTTQFQLEEPTRGLPGINDVQLIVNPGEFPELYYDNNILQLSDYLTVLRDELPPVLDVTFDGRYLLNDDYVSSKPKIQLTVWDDNLHLLQTDTAGFRLFLVYPCDDPPCEARNIWLARNDIKVNPATTGSPFSVDFNPTLLLPGRYTLRAEASDVSGNMAGPYQVAFQVSDEKKVDFIPLYPNPHLSQSRFGFRITSDGIPSSFAFEITDITGKTLLARDYPESFHVGRNEFVWDGRDDNGNALKPGMYPYRLILHFDGETMIEQGKIVLNP